MWDIFSRIDQRLIYKGSCEVFFIILYVSICIFAFGLLKILRRSQLRNIAIRDTLRFWGLNALYGFARTPEHAAAGLAITEQINLDSSNLM